MVRRGLVEGVPVEVLLDTGSARTLVRRELVPEGKVIGGKVVGVRCTHGEVVHYPTAEVVVGDKKIITKAGVSDRLPVQLLLGRDVPELFSLLATISGSDCVESELSSPTEQVVAVTRARTYDEPKPVGQDKPVKQVAQDSDADLGNAFSDDLFQTGREKVRQTQSQKRTERRRYAIEKCASRWAVLDLTTEELRAAQRDDPTLKAARRVANGQPDLSEGEGFYYENDILYRRWEPKGPERQHGIVQQLVLPTECRDAVLAIAHEIPLGGHLGKTKTAQRLLQRFYWPTVYGNVSNFCRACQLDSSRRASKAPLIPLPIIGQPFRRIAMVSSDRHGYRWPSTPTTSGKHFILVVCDYATRYPEAVPLSSTDAEHVAEELGRIFSRVGIPEEILTDQGANFMSRLLAEIYKFLQIKLIWTSPYHPQTDGLVKRFNRTLKVMVEKMSSSEGATTVRPIRLPGGAAGVDRLLSLRTALWARSEGTSIRTSRGMGAADNN